MADTVSVGQPCSLVISIVSHGHIDLVQRLMLQIACCSAGTVTRVVLTHNIEEPALVEPEAGWPFQVDVLRNQAPKGFGANHNCALRQAEEAYVCVLNPDVELLSGTKPFDVLLHDAAQHGVGCAYPTQVDHGGRIQESERELPSLVALWSRRALRRPQRRVDWVNAACLVMPAPVWRTLKGFDESYFMYCEDVDLCLRLTLLGVRLHKSPVQVIHAGQRNSSRSLRHLVWHVRSLLRLWSSPIYRRVREQHIK